jgi:ADP-ribose pyrophosphatase YjhB (NUDIX family)
MEYREDADVRINDIESRGIILKDENVLVMFRRKDGYEYYTFPGGHMREGETPLQTVLREIEEETTVVAKDLVKVIEYSETVKREKKQYYFFGKWNSGEPVFIW